METVRLGLTERVQALEDTVNAGYAPSIKHWQERYWDKLNSRVQALEEAGGPKEVKSPVAKVNTNPDTFDPSGARPKVRYTQADLDAAIKANNERAVAWVETCLSYAEWINHSSLVEHILNNDEVTE